MSVECCVREEENSLGCYVANSEEITRRNILIKDNVSVSS